LLKKESVYLKTLFHVRSSFSAFPVIKWFNFSEFINDLKILDQKFEQQTADRIYISVTKNVDKELHGILPEKDMSRLQFYEALVRIAFFKYKMGGITHNIFSAVQKLITQLKSVFDNY
jgi:hypothetical protein